MFNTFSDPYLVFAFWAGAGVALLTALLLLAVLGLRLLGLWRERREKAFVRLWQPALMRAVLGRAPVTLPRLRRHEQWWFLKLWNHFQETLRGDVTEALSRTAYELGCHRMARKLLSGTRAERLFAVLTLGNMRDASAWSLLQTRLGQGNRALSLYAARALLQIDAARGAQAVVPLLLLREDWEMVRATSLLWEFRDQLGDEMSARLAQLDAPENSRIAQHLPRALRLAEALRLELAPNMLLPLLRPEQPVEVLLAALRLARGAQMREAVRACAVHADWRVRVQVTRALGRLAGPADLAQLVQLLQDPQWWVRYRAAQALLGLPFLGAPELDALVAAVPDRYAREIFEQVRAEARVGAD